MLTRFLIFRAVHRDELQLILNFFFDVIMATTLFVQPVMLCIFRGLDNALDAVYLENVQRTCHGGNGRECWISSMLGVSGGGGFGERDAGVSDLESEL